MNEYYVLKNEKTGKFINIDRESGGYPYDTELIYAKFFSSISEAGEYNDMFKKERWKLGKLKIDFIPIPWPEENVKQKNQISLDEAKELVALKFRANSWKSVQKDFEYGMGVSKLMSIEEFMDIVAETYLNNGLL
jgi:hypothetical protein